MPGRRSDQSKSKFKILSFCKDVKELMARMLICCWSIKAFRIKECDASLSPSELIKALLGIFIWTWYQRDLGLRDQKMSNRHQEFHNKNCQNWDCIQRFWERFDQSLFVKEVALNDTQNSLKSCIFVTWQQHNKARLFPHCSEPQQKLRLN